MDGAHVLARACRLRAGTGHPCTVMMPSACQLGCPHLHAQHAASHAQVVTVAHADKSAEHQAEHQQRREQAAAELRAARALGAVRHPDGHAGWRSALEQAGRAVWGAGRVCG